MSELLEHLGHMGSLLCTLMWVRAHLAHRQWNPRGRSDTLETCAIQLGTIDLLGKDTQHGPDRTWSGIQHPGHQAPRQWYLAQNHKETPTDLDDGTIRLSDLENPHEKKP